MTNFIKPSPMAKEAQWDKTKLIINKTDRTGAIKNINKIFKMVSGYSDSELKGQPYSVVYHPDMPTLITEILVTNIKNGNNFTGIFKNMSKKGEYYWSLVDFELKKNIFGKPTHYLIKNKAVPDNVVHNYIEPFYDSLRKLEGVGGVELGCRFFRNYMDKQGLDYVDFVISAMEKHNSNEKADFSSVNVDTDSGLPMEVYAVTPARNEKRKSLLNRWLS